MKRNAFMWAMTAVVWCGFFVSQAISQGPTIQSFQGNGMLVWSNAFPADSYRLEWAATPDGPWNRSWRGYEVIEKHTGTSVSVAVPMFFRVVAVTNDASLGMVHVPAGEFTMGDSYSMVPNAPPHRVSLDAFYIDRYEVSKWKWDTVREWALTNLYNDLPQGQGGLFGEYTNHPVSKIAWYDALKWCNARSEMEGLNLVYVFFFGSPPIPFPYRSGIPPGPISCLWERNGYRLPTEAEWEKAARGGLEEHFYPWRSYGGVYSSHIDGSKANYTGSGGPYSDTTPIGYYNGNQFPLGHDMANGYGLYDMAGNIGEMCWDWYEYGYYTNSPFFNPRGPDTGSNIVTRGGAWSASSSLLMCSVRSIQERTNTHVVVGFRCARSAVE